MQMHTYHIITTTTVPAFRTHTHTLTGTDTHTQTTHAHADRQTLHTHRHTHTHYTHTHTQRHTYPLHHDKLGQTLKEKMDMTKAVLPTIESREDCALDAHKRCAECSAVQEKVHLNVVICYTLHTATPSVKGKVHLNVVVCYILHTATPCAKGRSSS